MILANMSQKNPSLADNQHNWSKIGPVLFERLADEEFHQWVRENNLIRRENWDYEVQYVVSTEQSHEWNPVLKAFTFYFEDERITLNFMMRFADNMSPLNPNRYELALLGG